MGESDSRYRLRDNRSSGEHEIGDDDNSSDGSDDAGLSGQMSHQHKKRDAGARPEQDRRADNVQILEHKVSGRHRSSSIASATRLNTMIGPILSMGPSGSNHIQGTRMVPMIA